MSETSMQHYRDQVVAVAVRQNRGDLFGSCELGQHAWRVTEDGFYRRCKWCADVQAMLCGDCGYLAIDCAYYHICDNLALEA